MYETILVTLDASPTDRAIIDHVKQLAARLGSQVVLLHVATGIPAQWLGEDAGGEEIEQDRAVLASLETELKAAGIATRTVLAFGDPVKEIVAWAAKHAPDLIAMSTHGHQLLADVLLGTVATRVQHQVSVPVLLLRAC